MKQIDYSIIESVEDLKQMFGLVTEKEDDNTKKDLEMPEKKVKAEKIPVIYSDLTVKKFTNIFKHWIIFTNDRTDKNKTLKNIHDSLKDFDMKPEIHVFVAAQMDAEEDESKIIIRDDEEEFTVEKESNLDTLVFSRLGVQGEDECEHVVRLLQDRGFLVLNPVKYSALACNKYESACLFEKGGIPQPRFCLMTKEDLYDEESFKTQITRIYPNYNFNDPDKNSELDVVVKILDGHGGTGVFTCDCKKMIAILQAIFAIDLERQLFI